MNSNQNYNLDLKILRNGALSLFHQESILEEAIDWFKAHGFLIYRFNCKEWKKENDMHSDLSNKLNFPQYYGYNLDALNDCLGRDINIPQKSGIIFVFMKFNFFSEKHSEIAWQLLDMIEDHSRGYLLSNQKLIALVQSDDPKIKFKPVGARPVTWNQKEWLNKNRNETEIQEFNLNI